MRNLLLVFTLLFLANCAVYNGYRFDQRFGPANPSRFDQQPATADAQTAVEYWRDVKPITDNRCTVCHGCFDAPCQLQMGSFEGIRRGGSKNKVYDALRLFATEPSRLFIDGQETAAWRLKGFNPVLNERNPEGNMEASVMAQMIKLKDRHHFPSSGTLPNGRYDFSLDRSQSCPAVEEFDEFAQNHPEWGMPYGLPGLSQREENILLSWLQAGSPALPPPEPSPTQMREVAQWEAFLNGSTFKAQLMSRYIYEHWFLGHLYFDQLPEKQYFELVRSKTPPGKPMELIATRRPYDDPGVPRVYYRLRPLRGTVLAKTHMPYALNTARMAKLKSWFLDEDYRVTQLPGYDPVIAGNPFKAFEAIPVGSRYRFMLDEAQFTLMGFIKGPVCRGQVALNVINDYFWVGFTSPDEEVSNGNANYLAKVLRDIRLPSDQDSDGGLFIWRTYAKQENDFLRAKSEFLNNNMVGRKLPSLGMLWDGDGKNPNAALTVFRHFDSASVVQGLVGEEPQTALILGYPVLERMHYLLTAGFDVFGNTVHQLNARLYMDFLRMEGEFNVLSLLPKDFRNQMRDTWYRGASPEVKEYLNGSKAFYYQDSGITYASRQPWQELLGLWKTHLRPVLSSRYELSSSQLPKEYLEYLRQLAQLKGKSLSMLPEASFLTVRDNKGRAHQFTLLRNSAHSNIAGLFDEENRRLPDADTLTVATGFIGAYPNAFYTVEASQLPRFVNKIRNLNSETDYAVLASRFALRRTDSHFWAHSDELMENYRKTDPIEAGLFDLNRFENR